MTRLRGPWTAAAAVTLFLIAACARPDGVADGTGEPKPTGPASSAPADPDALVLRVERLSGLMAPAQMPGRFPLVSVYADGRLITQGPQIAIYPPPALSNVQVQRLDRAAVDGLLDKADAAGIRPGLDLGRPIVADAPTTRITVAIGGGTRTLEVVGLTEAGPTDPRLTPVQREARAKVAAFVQEITGLPTANGTPEGQPYRSASVAALSRPYVPASDGLPEPPHPFDWPGPPLPGTTGCVTVSGVDAGKVLAAAAGATAITPWRSGGRMWSVRFRPLLPDETGCADLAATR
jgi:hypothetical protein